MHKKPSIKELPHLAFTDLPPPYPEHAYFEGHGWFPFEHNSDAYSLSNAWWLAEAATLVYADPDVVIAYDSQPPKMTEETRDRLCGSHFGRVGMATVVCTLLSG